MIAALGAGLLVLAHLIARALLPRIERAARATGYVDRPDGARKDHGLATPYGGGLAVFAAVGIPAALGAIVAFADGSGFALPAEIAIHLPGIRSQAPRLIAILLGGAGLLLVGYRDDRSGVGAWPRLLMQIAAAGLLTALGVRVTLFAPWEWAHIGMTIVFIVTVVNAFNFIDNMNGALAGVAIAATAALAAHAIGGGQWFMAAILLCLLGGLTAFIGWNYPVARVFVGDAGSYLVGFLLAALTVAGKFEIGRVSPRPFIVPLLILAVPLADAAVVVVTRLRRGVHPFTAGRDHLAHRLVGQGLARERAVVVLWQAGLATGVAGLLVAGTPWTAIVSVMVPVSFYLGWIAWKAT